jgi:alpha-tubulin suppressor-like RCC1 family protein
LSLASGCAATHPEGADAGPAGQFGDAGGAHSGDAARPPRSDTDATSDGCVPATEVCNNVDDDCDELIDEDVPAGDSCSVGEGRCRSDGRLRCEEGRYAGCSAEPTEPGVEACDGVDDDCDGEIDEGTAVACWVGIGACGRAGSQDCTDGVLADCSAAPGEPRLETCDGADEDCDGSVDEGALDCGIVALALGSFHSCALRRGGSVHCWGNNARGELGNEAVGTSSRHPVVVSGISDAVQISAGESHTCALVESGRVACWGSNTFGQMGDGSWVSPVRVPVWVSGISDAIAISAGGGHTCALRRDGGVSCWGRNADGELGDGTTDDPLVPVDVVGLSEVVEVAAGGAHSCARAGGRVLCWGANRSGQLGDGTTEDRHLPTAVLSLSDAAALSGGGAHTCVRRETGGGVCWGRNAEGQLGDGTTAPRATFAAVDGSSDMTILDAGSHHTCARLGGALVCWGYNSEGQVGDGSTVDRAVPTAVVGIEDARLVCAGTHHTCALVGDGSVACWGNNASWLLGDGTLTSRLTPVRVLGL